jgi:hypothetical protein
MAAHDYPVSRATESQMNALRKKHGPVHCAPSGRDGVVVDYSDEVTAEEARRIDEYLKPEFQRGKWVTVEEES